MIAGLGRSVPQLAIQGAPNVSFDPQKFTWLGSLSAYTNDAYLLTVIARHPAKTIEDVNKPGMAVNLGTDRAGATNVSFSLIAKEVLGLQVNLVRGYQGAAPIFLAMQRGEVDGQVIGLSSILAGQRALWDGKELRPLLQFGRLTRLPELPDVPTGREIAKDDKAKALLEFAELPFFMALPFAAPPDLRPTAPRRCNRPSWRCATTRVSSKRPRGSVSTSARSTARNREPAGPRRRDAEGRDRSVQRDREEVSCAAAQTFSMILSVFGRKRKRGMASRSVPVTRITQAFSGCRWSAARPARTRGCRRGRGCSSPPAQARPAPRSRD